MAKKQSKKQGKKLPTLKRQRAKKLSKIANKLLDHYEGVEALRKIGEKSEASNLLGSLGDIFSNTEEVPRDTFSSKVEQILKKLKTLKQLILLNITSTEDKKNFDTDEYREDRKFVTDTVFRIHATNEVDNNDLKKMNTLYKKHKRIKQLFD